MFPTHTAAMTTVQDPKNIVARLAKAAKKVLKTDCTNRYALHQALQINANEARLICANDLQQIYSDPKQFGRALRITTTEAMKSANYESWLHAPDELINVILESPTQSLGNVLDQTIKSPITRIETKHVGGTSCSDTIFVCNIMRDDSRAHLRLSWRRLFECADDVIYRIEKLGTGTCGDGYEMYFKNDTAFIIWES